MAYDLPFSLAEVLDLCGERNIKNEKRAVCPFCGAKGMFYNLKRNTFHCFTCDAAGGTLSFYRDLNGLQNNNEARKEIMKRLYGTDEEEQYREAAEKRKVRLASKVVKEETLRDIFQRDDTYSSLLSLLRLSSDHLQNLKKRGLSDTAIKANGYKTVPETMLKELCIKLLEEGKYLDGVPGFYKDHGNWTIRTAKRGILIPIRNSEGMIQGFQIRKDNNVIVGDEGKYSWLSSKDLPSGVGAPGAIHYACDFADGKPVVTDGAIFLTEGPLKGDISHLVTGKPFLCVPGVNCQTMLEDELKFLKEHCGLRMVYNAYDMDYLTNPHVQKALDNSYRMIESLGLKNVRLTWDSRYKGIDDYLVR